MENTYPPTVYLLGTESQNPKHRSFWVDYEENCYGERLELRGYKLTKELAEYLLSLHLSDQLKKWLPTKHWFISYNAYKVNFSGSCNEPIYIQSFDEAIPFLWGVQDCEYKKVTLCVSDLTSDNNARESFSVKNEKIISAVTSWYSRNLDFPFMNEDKKDKVIFYVKENIKSDYCLKMHGESLLLSLDLYIRYSANEQYIMDWKSICYHNERYFNHEHSLSQKTY